MLYLNLTLTLKAISHIYMRLNTVFLRSYLNE